MASFNEQNYIKRHTGTTNVAARKQNKLAIKEMVFAGIQAAGGAALAFYTYENSGSLIGPSVCSAIALGGTFNVLRSMRKIVWRSACNEEDETCSANNVATGTIIYFGSLYAFSEAWRSNDKLWIPCLGSAALGFFYAASSTYSKKTVSTMKPLLKFCQLAFEPALIVCGATYLVRFRNHEEEWLYWSPMVATALTGFKFAVRGFLTGEDEEQPNILLLKAIEVLMGGCFLTVSSTILAIYVSVKEIHQSWKSYATATAFFGVFVIFGSITCFQRYVGMDEEVAYVMGTILTAPIAIFLACLMVKCSEYKRMAYAMFPFLAGGGYAVLWASIRDLYTLVPRPVFIRYCQWTLGPLLIVTSSAASAYIGYRYGWDSRYCLLMMPFVPAGIYVTYKGFSRTDES